ncbi:MAG: Gfo/Idh/MocA family oxidoreductase [Spirochaetaceae bacterium]|nr:Gfo/Idh/MocA family oxidoreductase [Spirochaetaceae bacterium]
MIKFGFVGLGVISEIHARALNEVKGAVLHGGFSPIPSQVEEFSSKWGCKAYYSIEDIMNDTEINAISICSPSGAHLQPALQAIKAGKHLIIEKPIEVTSERAEQIIKEARKKGVIVTGVFQSRFYEASQYVKQALNRGRFGRISLVDAYVKWYRSQEYYSASGWRGTWEMDGGGALMNQSIHMVDMLSWLMGTPEEIYCLRDTLGHDDIEVEDTAVVTMQFSGGAVGVLEGTTAAYPGFHKRYEVSGTRGSVIVEEDRIVYWQFEKEDPSDIEVREKYKVGSFSRSDMPCYEAEHSAHARQYENMVSVLNGEGDLAVDAETALRPIKLIECAYASARKNRPVKI